MISPSAYIEFTPEAWAELRADTPLTLNEQDLERLQGVNEIVSMREVSRIYLPLSRLLNLYVEATQGLYNATATFLGNQAEKVPYVIGLAGSVAVGKSTTARLLRALLARWPSHPRVALVTTDGFLYPNHVLSERGLMHRKGFPETYDRHKLLSFVSSLKAGESHLRIPVYSHMTYDIVEGEELLIDRPDVVIIEGLNVLQSGEGSAVFVSDFFDFKIYVDAEVELIEKWYIERFLKLRSTAFQDPASYFHRYGSLTDTEATAMASEIWSTINAKNLRENIEPTRERADLIISKSRRHRIERVKLRKI